MGKLFINGKIKVLTGLYIGASKTDAAIGDIDNCVIKTSEGIPYIPGSSLKGKIRSLLEKSILDEIVKEESPEKENLQGKNNSKDNSVNAKNKLNLCTCGSENCKICVIFGSSADKRSNEAGPTRLIVRDCHLTEETRRKMENKEGEFKELELNYTESKWENVIDRLTSRAEHPRQTERVPAGAEFDFQIVFNLLEKQDIDRFFYFISGLNLLQDDYLGGNGSRGYGRIEFSSFQVGAKTISDYEGKNEMEILYDGTLQGFSREKEEFADKLMKKLGLNDNEDL